MQLLSDACALMTRRWEKTQGWQSMLVAEIARRLGAKPADELRANAVVAEERTQVVSADRARVRRPRSGHGWSC
ncbi:hypothetical protein [Lentzea sp.]|uniref:hypothetical protein n=1 Tax=Lentzea sp. TaxID=56099 RepID=UPI002C43E4AE|nr:hypothetical protein [Lentzea sp.]HUQ61565.1 hypothetical protein [Lentzea sp.]